MSRRREDLVRLLADGREHSGEVLAESLNISRAAVWKQVHMLADLGLHVRSATGRGYQLDRRLDLLDVDVIEQQLAAVPWPITRSLRVSFECPSTNSELLELLVREPPPPGLMDVLIAEYQSCGRGRRGRSWLAPLASGLCLSVSWSFDGLPAQITSLGLIAGVAVAKALDAQGVPGVKLKWPNDLWIDDRKLGGILIEMRAEAAGPALVVIGIGINVDLPDAAATDIAQHGVPPIDLRAACPGGIPSRTLLAARIVIELSQALRQFVDEGFAPFMGQWRQRDALSGRVVRVLQADSIVDGRADGIDDDGALLVATAAGVCRQLSGDVTIRVAEA